MEFQMAMTRRHYLYCAERILRQGVRRALGSVSHYRPRVINELRYYQRLRT